MSTDRQASAADIEAAQDALAQAEGESVRVPTDPIHKRLVAVLGVAADRDLPRLGRPTFPIISAPRSTRSSSWRSSSGWRSRSPSTRSIGTASRTPNSRPSISRSALHRSRRRRSGSRCAGTSCCRTCRTGRPETLILSAIMLVLVLEGLRRCTGWGLLSVVVGLLPLRDGRAPDARGAARQAAEPGGAAGLSRVRSERALRHAAGGRLAPSSSCSSGSATC